MKLSYTHAFHEIDPAGDKQVEAEEAIASLLFDTLGQGSLFDYAFEIGEIVNRAFGRIDTLSVLAIAKLVFKVRTYLKGWKSRLESSYGPNEEECHNAGKELLLIILQVAHPAYVEEGNRAFQQS